MQNEALSQVAESAHGCVHIFGKHRFAALLSDETQMLRLHSTECNPIDRDSDWKTFMVSLATVRYVYDTVGYAANTVPILSTASSVSVGSFILS